MHLADMYLKQLKQLVPEPIIFVIYIARFIRKCVCVCVHWFKVVAWLSACGIPLINGKLIY